MGSNLHQEVFELGTFCRTLPPSVAAGLETLKLEKYSYLDKPKISMLTLSSNNTSICQLFARWTGFQKGFKGENRRPRFLMFA